MRPSNRYTLALLACLLLASCSSTRECRLAGQYELDRIETERRMVSAVDSMMVAARQQRGEPSSEAIAEMEALKGMLADSLAVMSTPLELRQDGVYLFEGVAPNGSTGSAMGRWRSSEQCDEVIVDPDGSPLVIPVEREQLVISGIMPFDIVLKKADN